MWVFPDRTPLAAHPGVAAGPLLGLRVGNDRERLRPTLQIAFGPDGNPRARAQGTRDSWLFVNLHRFAHRLFRKDPQFRAGADYVV